ncbi:polyketide cyclase [Rhodoplanes elegans]|uniref:Polyketide cyclase n=1 Tax=Rhodoplanes elegans TaxID=29408 RepID=A0A327KTN1_9BRAD|nr:nuclear transport factor 2 family protein [Rhodoplanes elegans]MBK5959249.1 polyketide cyclase [Rhodoplanes elegans]RAI42179.1 polyketide cyclase [Rhodoplanes elegans]
MSKLQPSTFSAHDTSRPLDLPAPIAAYFNTDMRDSAAAAGCFAPDAVVEDEGHTYAGIAEIRRWKDESSAKYDYTSEPIRSESKDGLTVVTSRVTGNFPGSPIDLRYVFRVEGDRITSLEIVP